MNKREANRQAQENTLTISQLREMIASARNRGGLSRVNPQFTLAEVCDIYERGLAGRQDDEVPAGVRADPYSGRMKRTKDSSIIRNILRDCAPSGKGGE